MTALDPLVRLAAWMGAAAVTAVIVASQLYIANGYTEDADATLAARQPTVTAEGTGSAQALRSGVKS